MRLGRLRAACGSLQEEKGPETRPPQKTVSAGLICCVIISGGTVLFVAWYVQAKSIPVCDTCCEDWGATLANATCDIFEPQERPGAGRRCALVDALGNGCGVQCNTWPDCFYSASATVGTDRPVRPKKPS